MVALGYVDNVIDMVLHDVIMPKYNGLIISIKSGGYRYTIVTDTNMGYELIINVKVTGCWEIKDYQELTNDLNFCMKMLGIDYWTNKYLEG